MAASSKRMGNSFQPLKKPTVPTILGHHQFMDKNKQLTLLSKCNLAFTLRNMLMALKIRRDIKGTKENRRDVYSGLDPSIYVIKSPITRETVPLRTQDNYEVENFLAPSKSPLKCPIMNLVRKNK